MVYKDSDRIVDLGDEDVMADPDIYYAEMEVDTFGERLGDDTLEDELGGDEKIDATDHRTDTIEKGFGEAIGPDNPHVGDQLDDADLADEAEADFGTDSDNSVMKDTTIEK